MIAATWITNPEKFAFETLEFQTYTPVTALFKNKKRDYISKTKEVQL